MSSAIVLHAFGDEMVGQRADGYVDGTALCRANGKLVADYLRNGTTQAFLAELETDMGIPISVLVEVVKGGAGVQGTWVHPLVAYHLAQWCSARTGVLTYDQITITTRAEELGHLLSTRQAIRVGQIAAQKYRAKYGCSPDRHGQEMAGGAVRKVASYTSRDLDQ